MLGVMAVEALLRERQWLLDRAWSNPGAFAHMLAGALHRQLEDSRLMLRVIQAASDFLRATGGEEPIRALSEAAHEARQRLLQSLSDLDRMAKAMHLIVDHDLEPHEVEGDLDVQYERLHKDDCD